VLLACGAKPSTRNEKDWTAMHAAAAWSEACTTSLAASNAAVIQLLYGVNNTELLNAATHDINHQTALHLAVAWSSNVERLLQLGAAVNAVDGSGNTALYTACAAPARVSAPESVRLLLAAGATTGLRCPPPAGYTEAGCWQAVHAAALQYDTDDTTESILDVLLENGVSVDAATAEGCTAAWLVARYGTFMRGENSMLDVLSKRGAHLYHHTPQHGSLLHAAALRGSVEVMQWLFEKGLKVNTDDLMLRNGAGETPLHITATDLEGNTALRACLLGGKHCKKLFKVLLAASSGHEVDDDVLPDTG
jgi:ankyrin repeat protein